MDIIIILSYNNKIYLYGKKVAPYCWGKVNTVIRFLIVNQVHTCSAMKHLLSIPSGHVS